MTKEMNDRLAAMEALIKQQSTALAEAEAKLSQRGGGTKSQQVVKINSKLGLFVMDASVKAFSNKTQKDYTPSLNIHQYQLGVFAKILEDETLRKACIEVMKTGTPHQV